eukprot:Pgem_evm1s17199
MKSKRKLTASSTVGKKRAKNSKETNKENCLNKIYCSDIKIGEDDLSTDSDNNGSLVTRSMYRRRCKKNSTNIKHTNNNNDNDNDSSTENGGDRK